MDKYKDYPEEIHPFKNYTMKGKPPAIPQANPISVDPSDMNAVKAMVWEKLVSIASTMPATGQALPVLRELMDRMEGRPVQRTDSRVLTQSKGEIVIKLID